MHNDEILQIGALAARLYEASDDEADVLGAQFEQELDRIRTLPDIQAQRVTVLIFGLMSLLRGRPYVLNTDDFAKAMAIDGGTYRRHGYLRRHGHGGSPGSLDGAHRPPWLHPLTTCSPAR